MKNILSNSMKKVRTISGIILQESQIIMKSNKKNTLIEYYKKLQTFFSQLI